jgi:hypothetical protein
VYHLGGLGSNLGQARINGFVETHTVLHSVHQCQNRATPSWIEAWSLIRNEKPIVIFERNGHVTEKSETIDQKNLKVSAVLLPSHNKMPVSIKSWCT